MIASQEDQKLEKLLRNGDWAAARAMIEEELKESPHDHWLLTQLGVCLYEQRKYKQALKPLTASLKIVKDCPLTLWNLAGTLDALGEQKRALGIYDWILKSSKSAQVDPCWESPEWTEALKADCTYRVGICLKKLGNNEEAVQCFQRYLEFLSQGIEGTYSAEDAVRKIQNASGNGRDELSAAKSQKTVRAVVSVLKTLGYDSKTLPAFDPKVLLAGNGKRQSVNSELSCPPPV